MFGNFLNLIVNLGAIADLNNRRRVAKRFALVVAILLVGFAAAQAVVAWGTPFKQAVLWVWLVSLGLTGLVVWTQSGPIGDLLMLSAAANMPKAASKIVRRIGAGVLLYQTLVTAYFFFFAGHSTLGLLLLLGFAGLFASKFKIEWAWSARWFGALTSVATLLLLWSLISEIAAIPRIAENGWVRYSKERAARAIARSDRSYWEVTSPVRPLLLTRSEVPGKADTLRFSGVAQLLPGAILLQAMDQKVPADVRRVAAGKGLVVDNGIEYVPVHLPHSGSYPEMGFNEELVYFVPRAALAERANLIFAKKEAAAVTANAPPKALASVPMAPAQEEPSARQNTAAQQEAPEENQAQPSVQGIYRSSRNHTRQDWPVIADFYLTADEPVCVSDTAVSDSDQVRVETDGMVYDDPIGFIPGDHRNIIAKGANYPAPGLLVSAVLFSREPGAENYYAAVRSTAANIEFEGGKVCSTLNVRAGSRGSYRVRILRIPQAEAWKVAS